MQTQKLGTPELSNALLTAAETKVRGIGKNAELERAKLLVKLGREHYRSARYAMAEPLYEQVLDIRRRVLGDDHPDTAVILNNLALLYRDQGHFAQAEPLLEQALDIRRRVLGNDHVSTAGSLNNLAEFYKAQGHFATAEPLYIEAVEIAERVWGGEHPNTKIMRENYEDLLAQMKR